LELYASLIARRRELFSGDTVEWLESSHPQVLAFRRGDGICVVNFDNTDHTLPDWGAVALTSSGSADLGGGDAIIPATSAAWLSAALVPTAPTGHNHMRSNDAPHYL
jgi:alpha-glucosidase